MGKKIDFFCRVCGGSKYVGHEVARSTESLMDGPDFDRKPKEPEYEYYSCANCSTVFMDPKKFSNDPTFPGNREALAYAERERRKGRGEKVR